MMKIGMIIPIDLAQESDTTIDQKFARAKSLGADTCQVNSWFRKTLTDEIAAEVVEASKKNNIEISAFWCGWEGGPQVWDFVEGPNTLGIVPRDYRANRMAHLVAGADFAVKIGAPDIATHLGFLPEVPSSTEYHEVVSAVKYLANIYKSKGLFFNFETGQETPVTLRRLIEDVGTGNLGINLDPANLLMYGKANPIDALDVFGQYVRGIHGKDGKYPTDGMHLGAEVPMGEGKVNYPAFIAKLKEVGYDGSITIEREIFGDEQAKDIRNAVALLKTLI